MNEENKAMKELKERLEQKERRRREMNLAIYEQDTLAKQIRDDALVRWGLLPVVFLGLVGLSWLAGSFMF